jgi:cytoskeletal protein RodZ
LSRLNHVEAGVSIGDTLADSRRQAGLTISEVSRQTRIREAIIRDIEKGDFAACGGDFYARGHIRRIAGAIGIDPAPLIREYDAEHGPPGAIRAADVFEPSTPIKIRERRRGPSMSMIVVVVLLAIIGFSSYRLISSHHGTARPVAATTPSHRATASARPSATPTPSPTHTAVPSDDVVIQLTASEDCWVELTNSTDGSQIYMGVLSAGDSKSFTEKKAVDVRLGNPGGVVLTVNGKKQTTDTTTPVTLSFSPKSMSQSS